MWTYCINMQKETGALVCFSFDNKWNMICMVCGGIVGSFKSKGELYEAAKECVIDIIPRQIAINMANTQLGGRFGYPIVTHDNGAYVD